MRKPFVALLLLGSVSACASPDADQARFSWVDGVGSADRGQLSVVIADILANSLRPAQSTLSVRPAAGPGSEGIDVLVDDALRERGFALSPDGMDYPGAHLVRFTVNPVYQAVALRLDVDDAHADCLYTRAPSGSLQTTTPCTVIDGQNLALQTVVRLPQPIEPRRLPRAVHVPALQGGGPIQLAPLPATGSQPVASAPAPAAGHSAPPASPAPTPVPAAAIAPAAPPPMPKPPAAPPPAPPPVPQPTWTLAASEPIRAQVEAWGSRAGWTVQWTGARNWLVPVTTTFRGPFKDALSQVVRAAASQGADIRARFYDANTTVTITSPGAEQ